MTTAVLKAIRFTGFEAQFEVPAATTVQLLHALHAVLQGCGNARFSKKKPRFVAALPLAAELKDVPREGRSRNVYTFDLIYGF